MKIRFPLTACVLAVLASSHLQAATHTSLSGDAVVDTRYWSLIPLATENGTFTGGGIFDLGASPPLPTQATASPAGLAMPRALRTR